MTPTLALLLVHDLLLSKQGIALPAKHGLRLAVTRHRARLTAELIKARLRLGFASLDALRSHVETTGGQASSSAPLHPRWVRVNTLLTSLQEQLDITFVGHTRVADLERVLDSGESNNIYVDQHIPNLVALHPSTDLSALTAYKEGKIIIQEKASCFPVHLLDVGTAEGDVVDACAAPGNKTTGLCAELQTAISHRSSNHQRKVIACEKDSARSHVLSSMVTLAGAADLVQVRRETDFIRLHPQAIKSRVGALLLDPSCSGSGMIGRDEVTVDVSFPRRPQVVGSTVSHKKRKLNRRTGVAVSTSRPDTLQDGELVAEEVSASKLRDRLAALSAFQFRLLEHAMAFPHATRIVYSTCSVHKEENEFVVLKALASSVGRDKGWHVLERSRQVEGLRKWKIRGRVEAFREAALGTANLDNANDIENIADACIRCEKGGDEGTMGFFVAGFVRDCISTVVEDEIRGDTGGLEQVHRVDKNCEEEWNGFSDNEA